jgi:hypothetical protein
MLLIALAVAVVSARPYAGSWNDGSRLATVEALIDRHTWSIDDTIFVRVPHPKSPGTALPYPPHETALLEHGTLDKIFIAGHFYSDKSPVPALWLAGWYQLWEGMTGGTAGSHPNRFCLTMTVASSGLAYMVAVWCLYRLGRRLGLPFFLCLLLTSSFGVATVALPYVRHVNNHILLLAVTSALALRVASIRDEILDPHVSWRRSAGLGFLAGLGYTIDLGAGPVILLCTSGLVLIGCIREQTSLSTSAKTCLAFALAALPWLGLHHALNYVIGGSFKPANANPEYFRWPGCPFAAGNLTGSLVHPDLGSFLLYAASMLAGKRGFLGHNLPLFLTIPAFFILLRRCRELWRELLWALGCFAGTWLLYAATSNNSSGQCCTIRWFVPLLAPGYFVLALLLHRFPRYSLDLLVLSFWGLLLVLLMSEGPWMGGMVPFFWPIQIAALCSWAWCRRLLHSPDLELLTQHPYTTDLVRPSPSGAAALLLWITKPSSSGARANTISATSTSTCPATNSSSLPA